jgi:hypothetical protein
MIKIKFLGWALLPLNIIGLWYCVYALQERIQMAYLCGVGLFVVQIIYIVITLRVLQQFEISKRKLESIAKKAGLTMAKLFAGEKKKGKGET